MKIDELKENNVVDDVSESAAEQAMKNRFIIKFHYILCFLDNYMKQNKLTLEDLRQQVIDKTSKLSRSQRDFLSAWKLDFIQECLNLNKEYERKSRERHLMEKSAKRSS